MEIDLVIVTAAVALAVIVVIVMARRDRRAREAFHARSARAEGEVLEVWQDGTGSYCVRYRFTPPGSSRAIVKEEVAGCLRTALPGVGATVAVRYDPAAPHVARFQREGC